MLKTFINKQRYLRKLSKLWVRHLLKNEPTHSHKPSNKISKWGACRKKKRILQICMHSVFLEHSWVTLIYINKFHVSLRNNKLYNRSPRGSPTIILINHDAWTVSFTIVISSNCIEGINASINSINSDIFLGFV